LLDTKQISEATFEFSRSPITGEIGPTPSLRNFLEENGIKIIIY